MAFKTVAQHKDAVAGLLSGLNINNVDNLFGAFERGFATQLTNAGVPEASLRQNTVLYDGVYSYACDSRIFGNAIIDIRPQGVSRNIADFVYKRNRADFDRTKQYKQGGTVATFEYAIGAPIIRIVSDLVSPRAVIDGMNATTGWTAAGSASGLTADVTDYYQTPASLRFTLTGSSTGTLTKAPTATDLSSFQGVGVAFLAIEIPAGSTATNLSSIALRLGSSASDYNEVTATTGFLGAWVSGEWLLVALDMALATTTGTPVWTAIDYLQVRFAHTATFTNFRVGGLWIALPRPVQVLSETDAIFLASGSTTPLPTITSTTDQILLNNAAYLIYQWESAKAVLEQLGAASNDSMLANINKKLFGGGSEMGLYPHYLGDNPSDELRTTGTWYED